MFALLGQKASAELVEELIFIEDLSKKPLETPSPWSSNFWSWSSLKTSYQ